jgi:hypothetical protein
VVFYTKQKGDLEAALHNFITKFIFKSLTGATVSVDTSHKKVRFVSCACSMQYVTLFQVFLAVFARFPPRTRREVARGLLLFFVTITTHFQYSSSHRTTTLTNASHDGCSPSFQTFRSFYKPFAVPPHHRLPLNLRITGSINFASARGGEGAGGGGSGGSRHRIVAVVVQAGADGATT